MNYFHLSFQDFCKNLSKMLTFDFVALNGGSDQYQDCITYLIMQMLI